MSGTGGRLMGTMAKLRPPLGPGRRRGDPQPTGAVRVVLASAGAPFSARAAAEAARLAAGGPVAVVSVARVHGTAFGLQNPGLLPSQRERREQQDIVSGAMRAVHPVPADGQVVVTRNPGKAIARIARVRSARYVVLDPAPGGRLRRLVEGDHVASVRRRLGAAVTVVVTGSPAGRQTVRP